MMVASPSRSTVKANDCRRKRWTASTASGILVPAINFLASRLAERRASHASRLAAQPRDGSRRSLRGGQVATGRNGEAHTRPDHTRALQVVGREQRGERAGRLLTEHVGDADDIAEHMHRGRAGMQRNAQPLGRLGELDDLALGMAGIEHIAEAELLL